MTGTIKDLFVERRFDLESGLEVIATIFAPERQEGCYICEYTIVWPDRRLQRHCYGEDGMQAALLAMTLVEVNLKSCPEYESGKLTWLGMRRLGLPSIDSLN